MTARTIRLLCFLFTLLFALGSQPQALWAQETQKLSKNLIKRAEKTVEEIKKTEKQLDKTVKKYNDLLKKKKVKDRQKEYKKLNDEITTADSKFGEHYNKFLTDLKNQISYLNLDMSDDAVSKLKTNQKTTNANAKALFKSIDDLADATKDYIKSLK